mmetsp:Transcript_76658/g.153846  ORF Transcript_76658/g.153846 Transcript_76658/m.153846 type:complete len:112 (+) Transcript_76658:2-337(+)
MIVVVAFDESNRTAYAGIYCLFVIPVTIHVGVSHRDDVPLRKFGGGFRNLMSQMASTGAEEAAASEGGSSQDNQSETMEMHWENANKCSGDKTGEGTGDVEVDMASSFPEK